MKVYEVAAQDAGSGEYLLGSQATGSHACYLIYGVLKPGEQGRELRPGAGHEELVLAVDGDIVMTGAFTGVLKQGQAVHLRHEETCTAGNPLNRILRYVIAGGHSGQGQH